MQIVKELQKARPDDIWPGVAKDVPDDVDDAPAGRVWFRDVVNANHLFARYVL